MLTAERCTRNCFPIQSADVDEIRIDSPGLRVRHCGLPRDVNCRVDLSDDRLRQVRALAGLVSSFDHPIPPDLPFQDQVPTDDLRDAKILREGPPHRRRQGKVHVWTADGWTVLRREWVPNARAPVRVFKRDVVEPESRGEWSDI